MKNTKQIKCPDCQKLVPPSQLKQHVVVCKSYVAKLLPNTMRIAEYFTKDYLQFLVAELDIAKQRLMYKLNQDLQDYHNFASYQTVKMDQEEILQKAIPKQQQKIQVIPYQMTLGNERQQPSLRKTQIRKQKSEYKEQIKIQKQKQVQKKIYQNQNEQIKNIQQIFDKKYEIKQTVTCQNCKKNMDANDVSLFTYIYSCFHLICLDCLKSYITDQFVQKSGVLKCLVKDCKSQIDTQQIKQIQGQQNYDILERQVLRRTLSFTGCYKCKQQYILNQGNEKDAPKVNQSGKKLTKAQMQHYAKNRFVCPNPSCKQEQCKLCHAIPYHLGRTCTENQQFKTAKKCRYCNEMLKKGYTSNLGIAAFNDVCPRKQCEKKTKNACSKVHPCKHSCYGYIRQSKCLPCLNQKCALQQLKHDQNQDSYCSICYIEGLKAGPCVMSKCGHIFHYSCLQKRLQIRWHTPRILFGFCHCPLCKQWIELPTDCPLEKQILQNKKLHENIKQKALNRLKFQKLENDPKIKDPKSSFYNKPTDYAMAIYAYFECFKCKKSYFGGRKSCSDMMNQQSNNNQSVKFQAEKLICPQCCPVQTKNCLKHGKQFIAFKCKFCCNIGIWFCWGSTHFCDDCHKRQQKGEYISKIPKQKLPKCQGQEKCPSGGNHGQNGSQFSIGCLLCRNYKQEARNF